MSDLLSSVLMLKNRISTGVKLLAVCAMALLMLIPAWFVYSVVDDRSQRAAGVVKEISDQIGGHQIFLGPTLAIPYDIPAQSTSEPAKHGTYLVFPAQASASVTTATEERHRSLFRVPVFRADLNLASSFDLAGVPDAPPAGASLDWQHAQFVVGVSDPRGALADATLNFGGKAVTLEPARVIPDLSFGSDPSTHTRLALFAAAAGELAKPDTQFTVNATMRFSGAQRIAVLAYGKTTRLSMAGDWANPGFDGGFLPVTRSVTTNGFRAEWSVPFIARGVRPEGMSRSITGLDSTALGVSFIEVADPYQSVNRSLKYLPLFLGLVFLSYFVFEVTARKRVHPAQYLLVGVAQIVFYLLLLSLAERIGFDFGFLVAGAATVLLLSANAGWIFASRMQALKAGTIFTSLYAFIYMLLRLEDNALLLGAIASFLAVAAVMYCTRRIDWYGTLPAGSMAPAGNGALPPE